MCHLLSVLKSTTMLGLRTNLIVKEGLPQIFEGSRNSCMVLNRVSKSLCFRVLRQESQSPFNILKFAGRNSAIKGSKGKWCCTVSLYSDGFALPRYLEANRIVPPMQLHVSGGLRPFLRWRRFPMDGFVRKELQAAGRKRTL